jgi:hypothetical protein
MRRAAARFYGEPVELAQGLTVATIDTLVAAQVHSSIYREYEEDVHGLTVSHRIARCMPAA